jgi:hypothetical protein
VLQILSKHVQKRMDNRGDQEHRIMRGKGERGEAREEQDRILTRELVAYHGRIEGVLSRGETSVLVVETKGI